MDHQDTELLRLLAHDLYGSFVQVVQHYQQRLYAFARRLTGSAQDAEDIVQEAFVSAYVSLENYPPERIRALKLQAWLYRVTLHVYGHHARGKRLCLVPLETALAAGESAFEDREEERPEALFEQREQREALEMLLWQLPEASRVAITCYYFASLSYQEIAEMLDQPLGTVKSTIFRGVRQLRAMLNTPEQRARENDRWNTKSSNDKQA
jgi:RNA polymerase sigma-70 factor (ECF subfamily)